MNTKLLKHGAAILGIGLLLFFVGFFLVAFAGWWMGNTYAQPTAVLGFMVGTFLSAIGIGGYIQEFYA